jgi:hypothetical protein
VDVQGRTIKKRKKKKRKKTLTPPKLVHSPVEKRRMNVNRLTVEHLEQVVCKPQLARVCAFDSAFDRAFDSAFDCALRSVLRSGFDRSVYTGGGASLRQSSSIFRL